MGNEELGIIREGYLEAGDKLPVIGAALVYLGSDAYVFGSPKLGEALFTAGGILYATGRLCTRLFLQTRVNETDGGPGPSGGHQATTYDLDKYRKARAIHKLDEAS